MKITLNQSILISIVTVVKNDAFGLKETIESILNQNFKNYEYIVICGESNDKTYEVIEKYKFFIKKYVIEKDKGLYFAMNKALDYCQGKYINFLNSGDSYTSKYTLNHVVNELNDEIDILCGSVESIQTTGKKIFKSWKEKFHPEHHMFWYHQTMFSKKRLFDQNRFDTTFKVSSDYDWSLKQYLRGVNFKFTDEAIINFREGGFSDKNKIKARIEDLFIQSKYFNCDKSILEKNSFNKLKIYSKNNNFLLPKLLKGLYKQTDYFINKYENISLLGFGVVGNFIIGKYGCSFVNIYDNRFVEINNSNITNKRIKDPHSISSKTNEYIIISALGYEHEVESFLINQGLNKKLIIKFVL